MKTKSLVFPNADMLDHLCYEFTYLVQARSLSLRILQIKAVLGMPELARTA